MRLQLPRLLVTPETEVSFLVRARLCFASPAHNVAHGVIPFVARVFIDRTRSGAERIFQRPDLRKRGGIINGGTVKDRFGVDALEGLDYVQVRGGSFEL